MHPTVRVQAIERRKAFHSTIRYSSAFSYVRSFVCILFLVLCIRRLLAVPTCCSSTRQNFKFTRIKLVLSKRKLQPWHLKLKMCWKANGGLARFVLQSQPYYLFTHSHLSSPAIEGVVCLHCIWPIYDYQYHKNSMLVDLLQTRTCKFAITKFSTLHSVQLLARKFNFHRPFFGTSFSEEDKLSFRHFTYCESVSAEPLAVDRGEKLCHAVNWLLVQKMWR